MRKNEKFRDYDDNKMGGGSHDYMGHQNNYDASDDGFDQKPSKQPKKQEGNFKDSKSKWKGGMKPSTNTRKDYNTYGGGSKPTYDDPDDFLNDFDQYQPGEYKSHTSHGYQEGQMNKHSKPKEEFGNPSSGNKIYTNQNQFYSIPMKTQQNSGAFNVERNRNQNKGEEKLERIHFYNSEKFKLENNFEKLNIHGADDKLDSNYGLNIKEKNNNNDINNQGKKGKKGKKKTSSKIESTQSFGEKEEEFGNRKNKKLVGESGIQEHQYDGRSASSELNENDNMSGIPSMMQPTFMQQAPQGKPLPQFMPQMFPSNNPMMNQFKQPGSMYPHPQQQFVQMPFNNGQQFTPNMPPQQIPQFGGGPKIGVPNYGTAPFQNYNQPQIGGMQPMFYDPRVIRLPPNNSQQPQINSNFPMQFKPNDQVQFNNMQQMIQNNQQQVGKEMNDKQLINRGLNQNHNPTGIDPKLIHNQQIQDIQGRVQSNFNQIGMSKINPQSMHTGVFNMQQPRMPVPQMQMHMPNFSHQQRVPYPMMQSQTVKHEENFDKDSDSNQELNHKKEMNLPDFGLHEMDSPNVRNNQMLLRPQEQKFPGYGDFLTGKQAPAYHQQQLQPKVQHGFNFPYEEQQRDFIKNEMKFSGNKYMQQDYMQKYNQQTQEKFDARTNEYIPNQSHLN